MLDLQSMVQTLKRPGLLVRAARFGLDDYRRDRVLRRLLKTNEVPTTGAALLRLLEVERQANDARRHHASDYNASRHIMLLTAIMGEARILQAVYRQDSVT